MRVQQKGRVVDVLVATPAGETGRGGIDRIMALLKHELDRPEHNDIKARFLPTRGNGPLIASFYYLVAFCVSMSLARVRGRVDVVHINLASHGSTYRKLVITTWARIQNIPYVLHLHGAEYMTFWSREDGFLHQRIRSMFRNASRIAVLGQTWRNFVVRKVPEVDGRVLIVPNAAPSPTLAWVGGGDKVHILFLGRVESRKGIAELCDAFASMRDVPGWRATIAGDGNIEELDRRLTTLNISEKVTVMGWQGPEEVARLLSQADVLTLPSHAENLPMSVIEAMAAGLAVVATPVGAVEDIVADGETGFLVSPGNVPALRDALIRLIEDPNLRRRMAEAGRLRHREYLDASPFANRFCEIWREAANSGADHT